MLKDSSIREQVPKEEYPFKSHFLKLSNGYDLHYVDEGQGPVILLLHGNPTWSFYYRNLIKELKGHYRVIAPDHLGCGLSDKPQDSSLYTLKNHIDNLQELTQELKLESYSLVVHDWGGAIGCGLATRKPQKVTSLAIHNTAAFLSPHIPRRISILRNPLGSWLIRRFNAFAAPAATMAVTHTMAAHIKKGYLAPYNNYKNRIATAQFVRDIPMEPEHKSFKTLQRIENSLQEIKCPTLILWGLKDFCFTEKFLSQWRKIFPQSELETYQEGGHYLIEDVGKPVCNRIHQFFDNHITSASPRRAYEHCRRT